MSRFVIALVVLIAAASAQQPKYQQGGNQTSGTGKKTTGNSTNTAQKPGRYSYSPQFSGADQDTIRTCMTGTYGNPGLKVTPLPPELESQVQLKAKLSSNLQRRARPLPGLCTSRLLTTLPAGWNRLLLGDHVLLMDPNGTVSDMFDLK